MKKTPDWLDERIRLGEIPPHFAALAEARSRETDFERSQVELEESDRQILSHLPPDRFAAEVARRRAGRERIAAAKASAPGPSKAVWGSVALACLAGFVFVVPRIPLGPDLPPAPLRQNPSGNAPRETAPTGNSAALPTTPPAAPATGPSAHPTAWRTKGEVALVLQREVDGVLVPVTETDVHAAGTRLRLSVSDSLAWAAVFSIDSRGDMAQHWPLDGDSARPLAGMLPRSWELDDAPGKETFVLAWSETPFALGALRKAVFLDRVHPKVGSKLQVRVVQVARTEPPAR